MMAAGRANPDMVKVLLAAGADVFAADSRAGSTAMHKACQGGSAAVVKLLVDAGAFVDAVAPTTGHTPLMDALWFKYPDIVQYLLDQGAGLNLSTHYGFSLLQHFEYELNVNVLGKNKLLEAEKMIKARQQSDQAKIEGQKLMKAITDNDLETVKRLIAAGVDVNERYPFVNGFNDYHTPLLVACRDGHTDIVTELLRAGADVNAVEPTFGAVPLHKAVYNGHSDITGILIGQPGINLDYQGATNGYTPLHDALWHGYDACARILIEAGARLDLPGHDGKLPLDIAVETFGGSHEMVRLLRSK
jgi:ankyrin repeat protein